MQELKDVLKAALIYIMVYWVCAGIIRVFDADATKWDVQQQFIALMMIWGLSMFYTHRRKQEYIIKKLCEKTNIDPEGK